MSGAANANAMSPEARIERRLSAAKEVEMGMHETDRRHGPAVGYIRGLTEALAILRGEP